MDKHDKVAHDMYEGIVEFARDTIEPYKPEWAERREVAKTLISLASAALIFTITFSTSIITPSTSQFWRYSVLVCWLAFISSLACSLGSLWFSAGLSSLPVRLEQNSDKVIQAVKDTLNGEGADLIAPIFAENFNKIARQDLLAYRLLRISLCSFGIALLLLATVGIRQLFR